MLWRLQSFRSTAMSGRGGTAIVELEELVSQLLPLGVAKLIGPGAVLRRQEGPRGWLLDTRFLRFHDSTLPSGTQTVNSTRTDPDRVAPPAGLGQSGRGGAHHGRGLGRGQVDGPAQARRTSRQTAMAGQAGAAADSHRHRQTRTDSGRDPGRRSGGVTTAWTSYWDIRVIRESVVEL